MSKKVIYAAILGAGTVGMGTYKLCEAMSSEIEHKTGARGLRTIIENLLLDVMYEIPSRDEIEEVIVTKESIDDHSKLKYVKK